MSERIDVTRLDRGDHIEVTRTGIDPDTGRTLWETVSVEYLPGTPEHDEPINRATLADRLHALLGTVKTAQESHTDPAVRALAEAILLLHRFVHADYSDAEV